MSSLAEAEEQVGRDRQAARERAFRLLAVTVTALFVSFAALGGLLLWYDNATSRVLHTREVREGIGDVHQALSRAEAGHRLFLLVGDPQARVEVAAAERVARERIADVEALTRDNPAQNARVAVLRTLADERLALIERGMALATQGDRDAAMDLLRTGRGRALMAQVRAQLTELDDSEAQFEGARSNRARAIRMIGGVALLVFALALSALFIKALRDINIDREVEAEARRNLQNLVRQRTLLLAEVNHRVKNSLQQIASVVRLQARASKDPVVTEALEKTLARIVAVGRVHEQIYGDAGKVGDFDAGAYAASLARELVSSMGRDDVALECDVEPVILDMSQAAPLALVLNELITNALKYGCPADRGGRLRVGLRTIDNQHRLSISDDGDGLPEGFSTTSRNGLGMRVIEALSRQLGGKLVVEESNVGATFHVEFPGRYA